MGGSLFTTTRLSKDEYFDIQMEVLTRLHSAGFAPLYVPDTFHEKEDFGDLDILLKYPIVSNDVLKKLFKITDDDIYVNSSVVSFRYSDFQIDLCHFQPEDWETAKNYYRQSDCSNMVGVLFNKVCGFRLTHRGLVLPVKLDAASCMGEVMLSRDMHKILDFINLSYTEWREGFDTPEQLFVWLTKSKYFNPEFFSFESLNHENRTRNRKRKVYSAFVDWLKAPEQSHLWENKPDTPNKQHHFFRSLAYFENSDTVLSEIQNMMDDAIITNKSREVFNASDIIEMTGATGRQISDLKNEFFAYLDGIASNLAMTRTKFMASLTKQVIRDIFNGWCKNNVVLK